jgi:hypothetical protein
VTKKGGDMVRKIVAVFFLALLVVSCQDRFSGKSNEMLAAPSPETKSFQRVAESTFDEAEDSSAVFIDRKVIYTADVKIEVKDYDTTLETIRKIVKDVGGFVADSSTNVGKDSVKSGQVVVRVPSDKFQTVLTGISEIGKVKYISEHGADVTEEYADIETRLKNAKVMEARLLDLLEKNTKSVKDLLEVERELGRVRGNIERMEGRKKFLDDRLSLSTITVDLYEPYTYTTSIFDPVKRAFNSAGELLMISVGGLITFLAVVIPWFIVVSFSVWLVVKLVKRWRRKVKS